jgi:hypothetical protein
MASQINSMRTKPRFGRSSPTRQAGSLRDGDMTEIERHAVTADDDQRTHARALAAYRAWRYRRRRKRRLVPVKTDLFSAEIKALVAAGLLAEAERNDPTALGRALGKVVGAAIGLLRQGRLPLEK